MIFRLKLLGAVSATLCLLSGCAGMREGLDTTWRTVDPAGHRRYHRDKYYPHERKIGIRLPEGAKADLPGS